MSVRKSKYKDNSKVIVKPEAYYNMLVHVLRFGNNVRDQRQYREVMGMLIGRLEGEGEIKDVIIEDAVPISHGGSIEVAFAPEDYVSFSYVDAEYAERDPPLFTVGWYHSHPALKIFFSSTDIKNQLGWQTQNPSAIGIVFDHTYLDNPNDMGFRTFRLDNPAKGPMTEYHEVETIVEPPDSIDYYIKIMKLIQSIHAKEPPILEINETPDLFGEMIVPGRNQLMSKQPELKITSIMESFQAGINQLLENSLEPLIRYLNKWSQTLLNNIIETNVNLRNDIVELKDSVSAGIGEIQGTFKSGLTNKMYDLDAYFDDRLEAFDESQGAIKILIDSLKTEILQKMNAVFEESVKVKVQDIEKSLTENNEKLQDVATDMSTYSQDLETQKGSIDDISSKIDGFSSAITDAISGAKDKLVGAVSGKVSGLKEIITSIKKEGNEFQTDLDTALTILESTKQTLEDKIKNSQGGTQ